MLSISFSEMSLRLVERRWCIVRRVKHCIKRFLKYNYALLEYQFGFCVTLTLICSCLGSMLEVEIDLGVKAASLAESLVS